MSKSRKLLPINSEKYLRLADGVILRRLEKPFIFDAREDELYEINDEAADFLKLCDGTKKLGSLNPDKGFLVYCLEEGLMELTETPKPGKASIGRKSPIPSLRYLEIQFTDRCNLKCRHCYLGKPGSYDMPLGTALDAMRELDRMQGLRVLLSGGEPLTYRYFNELNEHLPEFSFRKVLITNGEKITVELAGRLNVEEIQVSLDGMQKGHDALRGKGSFHRAVKGIEAAISAGLEVSVATMVHAENMSEFDELEKLVRSFNAREWGIDLPLATGNLSGNRKFIPDVKIGAGLMDRAYGGSYHGADEGEPYGCGAHLCTIMPNGDVAKCGFYADKPAGNVADGLRIAWNKIKPIKLETLECKGCEYLHICAGGCRYRAEHPLAVDPVMCARYLY